MLKQERPWDLIASSSHGDLHAWNASPSPSDPPLRSLQSLENTNSGRSGATPGKESQMRRRSVLQLDLFHP